MHSNEPSPQRKEAGGLPASAIAFLRRRPDAAVFIVGAVLFAGGLMSVIGRQLAAPDEARLLSEQAEKSAPPTAGRVGPNLGEEVGPYLERRRQLASERSTREPREPTYAIVVFNSYRRASEVDALMNDRGLEVVSVQTRVPVPGFKPRDLPLAGRGLVAVAAAETTGVTADLAALEGIAKSVSDSNIRSIYEREIQMHRDALGHLGEDPATVFAVVVKGTNSAIGRTASAGQVRYVDLPEDPTATPADTTFAGLIPEDENSATFAVQ